MVLIPGLNKIPSSTPTTLADLPRLGMGRVIKVVGDGPASERLRELGFAQGTEVHFCRQAPFAGPIVVALRGYQLCLRLGEARLVLVEKPGGTI